MKFNNVLPVLAIAATASASACAPRPKVSTDDGAWVTDPAGKSSWSAGIATSTGAWVTDLAGKSSWSAGTATSTGAWVTDPAGKSSWSAGTATSTGSGWPSDPSEKSTSTISGWPSDGTETAGGYGTGIDWTATAPGSVLPGSVTSYGSFIKPTGPSPTNSKPPFQTGGSFNYTWGSTSQDAKNFPGAPNGPSHRGCWEGEGFDINTDYEKNWPNTGVVRPYDFTLSNTTLSPDGTPKEMLVVNGQYPGPLIECNWGDILEITVHNHLTCNGTSFHWHGFRQLNSNPQDGVNGITECPLAPGDTKTYRFQATSYGTTWYHSHHSIQMGDGVKGPVIVHGPASYNYDIDLGVVTLDEMYPLTAPQEDWFAHRTGPPQASNVLYNGKNIKPDLSTGERQKFTFTPGKKHLLRLVNTAVDSMFSVQIDNHVMTVISNDFVSINPYNTTSLSIGIGQRYEVVVEANQDVDSYWFRAIPQQGPPPAPGPPSGPPQGCCSNVNTGLDTANAIIQYSGASGALPTSNYTTFSIACADEPIASLVPVVTKSVDSSAFTATQSTLPVAIGQAVEDGSNVFNWFLNGISQDIDWENPTIGQAVAGNDSFPTIRDVVTLSKEGEWVFFVIQNQFFVPHPMHLHGHDFSLLGQGNGTFDPATMVDQLNFVNPTRRDVAMLIASGWTVIAFEADNPGAWLMHCHIGWHVGEGLSLQFLELPDQIPGLFEKYVDSPAFQDTCANWKTYSENPAYNKTDSGLKRRDMAGLARLPYRRDLSRSYAHNHVRHSKRWQY